MTLAISIPSPMGGPSPRSLDSSGELWPSNVVASGVSAAGSSSGSSCSWVESVSSALDIRGSCAVHVSQTPPDDIWPHNGGGSGEGCVIGVSG